jgi:sugar lactone lactonase YvrE
MRQSSITTRKRFGGQPSERRFLTGTLGKLLLLTAAVAGVIAPSAANAAPPAPPPTATQLLTGLEGGSGSTVGPGGALYVTESAAGRISRVDPRTGEITTFASGLPGSIIGIGGTTDVAFIGGTAYALVSVVGPDVGGSDVVGIYRIDGPDSFTVVADIGGFALANPPGFPVDVPTGVQYALQAYRGGFLVTDGHHNRVYRVTRDGQVSQLIAFGNIVPTGLETRGNRVYMAEAGPVPHDPADGKVVAFKSKSPAATEVASGAPLLVDVEFGRGRDLYALSQGSFGGGPPGFPAAPNTGSLVKVNGDGAFSTVVNGLDRPTSVELIGNTAYVVTLTGEIWKVKNPSGPPHGAKR